MARDHEAPERQAKKSRLHFKAMATALNVTAQEGPREAAQLNNGEWVQDEGEAEGQLGGQGPAPECTAELLCRWCEEEKLPALTTFLAGVTAVSRLSTSRRRAALANVQAGQATHARPGPRHTAGATLWPFIPNSRWTDAAPAQMWEEPVGLAPGTMVADTAGTSFGRAALEGPSTSCSNVHLPAGVLPES